VAKCSTRGCTGVPVLTTVDSVGAVGYFPSLAIGADGNPVIAYYDASHVSLKVAKCVNPACTGNATITTVDAGTTVGLWPSVAIGTDGNPVIAYHDATNADLKVAKCLNPACTGVPTITSVDTVGSVGYYASIEIGTDGNPVVAYLATGVEDLKVAKCLNPACTGASTISTVDSTGVVGYYPSLALGADGLPLIAYSDITNGDLKVAHCVTTACTGVSMLATLDSAGSVGSFPSLAFGVDGLPVVAYQDVTNGDLKVATCGTVTCEGLASPAVVESTNAVGYYTSLSIGVDGLPIIAHYDATNADLRVARCATLTCLV
jgi:hypothetical protein